MSEAISRSGTSSEKGGTSKRVLYLIDLLIELVHRDMKLRYERSMIGVLWAVVNPLAQLAVFVFIFQHVISLDIPNYPPYVFCGVIVWNWTRDALMRAANAITSNRDLIRQPGFPLGLLPVVSLATPLIDLLVALPLVILLVLYEGGTITFALVALPLVMALHFLLMQGFSYLIAAAQVLFRDTGHLLGVALMLGFYMTPIFYSVERLPEGFPIAIYSFNPMAQVIGAYRAIILHGVLPDLQAMAYLTLFSALLCWVGQGVFKRASHRFAEEL